MTPEQEDAEIIHNARAAYRMGEITKEQLHDVYRLVAEAEAERELK